MNEIVQRQDSAGEAIERVIAQGDLSKLSPEQRVRYYNDVCKSLDLNPLTRPFEYITLSGKLTLYARKDCTEQLRVKRGISIKITAREKVDDVYLVTAQATDKTGRVDESIGAVTISGLKGDAMANAVMKCETKAKRRVTLSISGLGFTDETELETIPNAQPQGRGSWRHEYAAMYSELQACGDEETALGWWHSSDTQEFVKRANEHHLAKGGVDYGSLLENEYMNLLPKLKKVAAHNPMKEQDAGETAPDVAAEASSVLIQPPPSPPDEPDESEITPGERKEMDYLASVDSCDTAKELSAVRKNIEEDRAVLGDARYTALKRACVARMKEIEIGATLAA